VRVLISFSRTRWEKVKFMVAKATQVIVSSSKIMPIKRKLMLALFSIAPPVCISDLLSSSIS
jgi:hypothetical protein